MKKPCMLVLPWLIFLLACEKRAELDIASAPAGAIKQGMELMTTHCNTCHGVGDSEMDTMLAPPLWGVRAHYLAEYPDGEGFVDAMTAFIHEPKVESSLLPLEVERYGLKARVSMPVTELRSIAWAIYAGQVERPPWSREYRKRHRECEAAW